MSPLLAKTAGGTRWHQLTGAAIDALDSRAWSDEYPTECGRIVPGPYPNVLERSSVRPDAWCLRCTEVAR